MAKDFKLIANLRKLFNEKNIKIIFKTIKLFKQKKPNAIIIHTFNTSLIFLYLLQSYLELRK